MFMLTRRRFLETLSAGVTSGTLATTFAPGSSSTLKGKRVAMIHATDLYRPHMDPDDHWDLACVFALAYSGDVELKGVLIDFPPRGKKDVNPDVLAVSQMNFITGKKVPVTVGSSIAMRARDDTQPDAAWSDHNGVRMVLDVLKSSANPVVINTTGSCRDIAIAGNREPKLFAEKCAGIYLNAGTGSPNRDERRVMEYGTYYRFRQDAILPYLSDRMQKFFVYTLARMTSHNWLSYLMADCDPALVHQFGASYRNMWCTGGFLHAAGYGVTSDGKIAPLGQVSNKTVFAFEPVRVACTKDGVTTWSRQKAETKRYIFQICDTDHYQSAMTKAIKALLVKLP